MADWKNIAQTAGSIIGDAVSLGISVSKAFKQSDRPLVSDNSKSIEFTYVGVTDDAEYKGRMFYTDNYFTKPSTEYDPSLATSSIALAMSCGNSKIGYEKGYGNVQELMENMGFSSVRHNKSYESLSSLDTIGVAIGSRKIGDATLLCIAIRGMTYGSEWGSNLLLGTGQYHQGFDEASDRTLRFIRGYLTQIGIEGHIKIWITGYSRSASTANLVAGKIDTAIAEGRLSDALGNGVTMSIEDLFAYCFEPAETVDKNAYDIHGRNYSNIWNHINPNDPVPILITSCFDMERFGNEIVFPCDKDPEYRRARDKMLEYYSRLPNREALGHYRTDFFSVVDLNLDIKDENTIEWSSQVDFLRDINYELAKTIGSRENYVETMQSGLSKYVADRLAYDNAAKFKNCLRDGFSNNKLSLVSAVLCLEKDDVEGIRTALSVPVSEALSSAGMDHALTSDFTSAIVTLFYTFRNFIKDNRRQVVFFLMNSKTIFYAHYPELIYSWLMSRDPNYILGE